MTDRRQIGYVSSTISTGTPVSAPYGIATGTPAVSATYSDGGFSWKRIDFTGTNTLVVTQEGLFDVMILGGGGGGGASNGGNEGGGGGGAGVATLNTVYLTPATYTITVGNGGGTGEPAGFGGWSGISSVKIQVGGGAGGGQRWGGAVAGPNSGGASYRGGYGGNAGAASQQLYGFSSGGSNGSGVNGGGAGQGGAGGQNAGGAGFTTTFTGTSTSFCGGGSGAAAYNVPGSAFGGANSGGGGGGAQQYANGTNGNSGFVCVRWKV